MGLQIRLRHALGERVVELRPRSSDHRWLSEDPRRRICRSPPSLLACAIAFFSCIKGNWVVQSADGDTALNGAAVKRPIYLHVGDVLTIGAGGAPRRSKLIRRRRRRPNRRPRGRYDRPARAHGWADHAWPAARGLHGLIPIQETRARTASERTPPCGRRLRSQAGCRCNRRG